MSSMPSSEDVRISVDITKDHVDIGAIVEEMINYSYRRGGGALAVFIGYVKEVVEGKRVEVLSYTAYESYALKVLRRIASEVSRKYQGIHEVRIIHRIGDLSPGATTLYIFVSGVSRKNTIRVLSEVLERVKHEAPIYKLEKREDGEYWVIGDKRVSRSSIRG